MTGDVAVAIASIAARGYTLEINPIDLYEDDAGGWHAMCVLTARQQNGQVAATSYAQATGPGDIGYKTEDEAAEAVVTIGLTWLAEDVEARKQVAPGKQEVTA